jgi:hypothetical protein
MNLCILLAPIIVATVLGVLQMLLDKLVRERKDLKVRHGCTCTRCFSLCLRACTEK